MEVRFRERSSGRKKEPASKPMNSSNMHKLKQQTQKTRISHASNVLPARHCVTGGLASEFALQVTVVLLRIRNCSILGRCFCDLVLIASMPVNHHHNTKILEILRCAVF